MKILRVVSSGFEEGGAESGIVLIQPILESYGNEIKILSSDFKPDKKHFNHYSYKYPSGIFGRLKYTFNFSAYFTLKKVLKEFKPDIVNLHTLGSASPLILLALKNYPTVATVHGPEVYTKDLIIWSLPKNDFKSDKFSVDNLKISGKLRYFYYRYVNYTLYKYGFKNIDCFVTISSYIRKVMKDQGVESVYIPNGIGMLNYKPLTQGNINHKLVFAGRLEKFKGVDYLIEALPPVVNKYSDTILYIAGTGSDEQYLKDLVSKLGLEKNVVFKGFLNKSELNSLYNESSVSCVTSVWAEIFSRVGVESMSAGLPVIGTDVGGIPEWLIDGQDGFLVPPQNSGKISELIIKLFDDKNLMVEMSKNARIKALEYDVKFHAEKINKLYKNIVKLGKRKSSESFGSYINRLNSTN